MWKTCWSPVAPSRTVDVDEVALTDPELVTSDPRRLRRPSAQDFSDPTPSGKSSEPIFSMRLATTVQLVGVIAPVKATETVRRCRIVPGTVGEKKGPIAEGDGRSGSSPLPTKSGNRPEPGRGVDEGKAGHPGVVSDLAGPDRPAVHDRDGDRSGRRCPVPGQVSAERHHRYGRRPARRAPSPSTIRRAYLAEDSSRRNAPTTTPRSFLPSVISDMTPPKTS